MTKCVWCLFLFVALGCSLFAGNTCPGSNIAPGAPGDPAITLTVASGSSPCGNSSNGALTNLRVLDPSWANPTDGSSWVSYENSVCIGCSAITPLYDAYEATLGYHLVPAGTTVNFTQDFIVPAGYMVIGGNLQVLSDDTVAISLVNSVFPSGTLIVPNDGYDHFCNCTVPGPPAFTVSPVEVSGSQLAPYLKSGQDNQLDFSVTQGAGESSYGVDWDLSLTLAPIGTPEPSTISIVGLGSFALMLYKRRRR